MGDPTGTAVVLGLARQGKALARFLSASGWEVTVSDSRPAEALVAEVAELADCDVSFALGEHPPALLDGCDLLCLSGGVPPTIPIVREALSRGIRLSNDAQEFLARSPSPVVGITGSAGKTTTTTLVGRMLAASGYTTWVGGNIGNPLIGNLSEMTPEDRAVMELSSFQLELVTTSPGVAGVLNVTPNHLDRHKTMEAYIAAKRNIVAHQGEADVAVLGYDEPNASAMAGATRAEVRWFSGSTAVDSGAYLKGDKLILRREGEETAVAQRDGVRLRGFHNVLNTLAAIALADAADATVDGMRQAIDGFTGVEHRLELVREWGGAWWVNDSIATAPERVLAALASFDEPLILLAGGRDKDLPWGAFARRVVERVRVLVLFGEAATLIEGHVAAALEAGAGEHAVLETMLLTATLADACAAAADRVRAGDVVLLSPGGTSFDAYRDFAERGAEFRAWVQNLPPDAA